MPLQNVSPGRYQIFRGVTKDELTQVAKDPGAETLQFAEPLSDKEVELLQSIVFSNRSDITLRVFGYYGHSCDLNFLQKISSAKSIFVDCLQNATGVEVLTKFKTLNKLAIGIFNLDNFEFLKDISPDITELRIEQTASRKPSIEVLKRFVNLKYLYVERQQKGIDAIQELKNLERIVLRSIATKDVSYLTGLDKLWSVEIKLGGIRQFETLAKLKILKYLELWQVKGLSDLSFISELQQLQNLFIQSLKQVTRTPSFSNSHKLKRVYLENLKGLIDLSSLQFAPNLQDFIYVLAENQEPENILPVLRNPNVKNVFCRFGSEKKNNHFDKLAKEFGKDQYSYCEFKYD